LLLHKAPEKPFSIEKKTYSTLEYLEPRSICRSLKWTIKYIVASLLVEMRVQRATSITIP
jgi:hypothetical protein